MSTLQKIVPHLWYDKGAVEAAEFYVSIFPNSHVEYTTLLHDTPSGDTEIVSFELVGRRFNAISAGPLFQFNPSISFTVHCATVEEVEGLWARLVEGGEVLIPLAPNPFAQRYGWLQDRYGVSWQLATSSAPADELPTLFPSLLFVGENYGRAEEAVHFYTSVFKNSAIGAIVRYGPGQTLDREDAVLLADFVLENQRFTLGESGFPHNFSFSGAISFIVNCEDQEEIDYYWERLSAVPEAEQCGWLQDRYGVSWQIVPTAMDEMMRTGTPEQIARVTQAFLPMKKFDLAALEQAFLAA
ncbi:MULTISPECIES: VOC family protein [Caldilinea]|uniref:VOC family protein n=1 Tax=Caldilinea TaxID=233191 RepID=UPI0002DA4484|nr:MULTISPECIES: VOC family protein [Caldilinea]GIV72725.1 MAG: VOC family protein [Caldilinea sp.]